WLVPTGAPGEATTCNTSIGPVLRGSSCAVILLIKKTTIESCARMPLTPASRAAPGMPSSGVGGLSFAVDPQLSADQATVFWRANALPTVVPLAPSPTSFTGARAIDFAELGEVKERAGPDGRHVIIRTDSMELRVWLLDYPVEQPLALALPLDDDLPIRVPAALRLWARIVRCAPARGRAVEDIFVARYDDQIGQRWACADASGLPQAASRPLIPHPVLARFRSSRFDTRRSEASEGKSRFSALRGSDFITSIFTIPLRTRTPTLWPPTRRRSPSAATILWSFDHARSSGRVAATLSSHTRGCALSRPVGPHTRETPHLRHRPEVSKDRRACCLCARRPESVGRSRCQDVDFRSRRRNGLSSETQRGAWPARGAIASPLTMDRDRYWPCAACAPVTTTLHYRNPIRVLTIDSFSRGVACPLQVQSPDKRDATALGLTA